MTVRRGLRALTIPAVLGLGLGAALCCRRQRANAFQFLGLTLFEDQADADAEAVIADPQPYTATITTNATGEVDAAIRDASEPGGRRGDSGVGRRGPPGQGARRLSAHPRRALCPGLLRRRDQHPGRWSRGGDAAARCRAARSGGGRDHGRSRPAVHFRHDRDRQPCAADERCRRCRAARRGVGFASGQVAKSTVVLAAEQLALKAWRQQGYAKAAIASRDVVADHDTNTVDVTITVNPGGEARVGDIGGQRHRRR